MAERVAVSQRIQEDLSTWYPQALLEETIVLQGSVWGWLFGRWGQGAVTLNGTVHLTHRAPDLPSRNGTVLLGHELFHVLQQREMGWWRFLLAYIRLWRPRHLKDGRSHPLEAPAYVRADEIARALP